MKPEVRFSTILFLLFIFLFIFARLLAPTIKEGVENIALGSGYEKFESEKFRIYYHNSSYSAQSMTDMSKVLLAFTTDFRNGMKKQGVSIKNFKTCTIFLLRSHDKLVDFGMQMEVADMSNNGGYFSPSTTSIAVIGADLEVLKHETVHLLLYISANISQKQLPPWIDEGFAQYFEKYPENQSLHAVEHMPSIEDIVVFNRTDFSKPDNPIYYKSSLYLLTFLIENVNTKDILYKTLKGELESANSDILRELDQIGLRKLNIDFKNWYINLR
ncbi:MAG: hypothetical protein K8S87_01835 [Planctomycetes bacterium]|nr:hypothetical protein [Planctomycetota bacterium]